MASRNTSDQPDRPPVLPMRLRSAT